MLMAYDVTVMGRILTIPNSQSPKTLLKFNPQVYLYEDGALTLIYLNASKSVIEQYKNGSNTHPDAKKILEEFLA